MYMKYFFLKYINYTVKNKIVKRKRVFGPSRTFAECPRQTIWADFQPTKCQRKQVLRSSKKQPLLVWSCRRSTRRKKQANKWLKKGGISIQS